MEIKLEEEYFLKIAESLVQFRKEKSSKKSLTSLYNLNQIPSESNISDTALVDDESNGLFDNDDKGKTKGDTNPLSLAFDLLFNPYHYCKLLNYNIDHQKKQETSNECQVDSEICCRCKINIPKIYYVLERIYETPITDNIEISKFQNRIDEIRKALPAKKVLEVIVQAIREHMINRKNKLYENMRSLNILVKLNKDNMNLLFQSSRSTNRRQSQEILPSFKSEAKTAFCRSREFKRNNQYVLSEFMKNKAKYAVFLKTFFQVFQNMSFSAIPIEKKCRELIKEFEQAKFPHTANIHYGLFNLIIIQDKKIQVICIKLLM
jgi:hypothetical protein